MADTIRVTGVLETVTKVADALDRGLKVWGNGSHALATKNETKTGFVVVSMTRAKSDLATGTMAVVTGWRWSAWLVENGWARRTYKNSVDAAWALLRAVGDGVYTLETPK